jgi:predicted dehydrogenase
MRQILQSLQDGEVEGMEIPCPALAPASVLIRTVSSVISSGTERMLMQFGKSGWIERARQHPDRVKLLLDKARTDGVAATIESVQSKLSQPIPLGYSSCGVVVKVGPQVTEFRPGDRIISNGPHAEIVTVGKNLCARVPDSVTSEAAAFTVLGAIALQGIRLAQPTLGESVAVVGAGLIGLLTIQLLRAQGCRVLAIDLDRNRLKLAEQFGARTVDLAAGHDPITAAERFSNGRGVDAVLITAATKSNEPVHQAALISRKKGRIVLVGAAGTQISRDDFYKKELSFQVSCSYGPGRYDSSFEEAGQDYPFPFVRWTAQRNFEAVLEMLASHRLDVEPLITHRFAFNQANEAYQVIETGEPHLGIVLQYPAVAPEAEPALLGRTISIFSAAPRTSDSVKIGLIGAGNYALRTLIPAFQKAGAQLETVVSRAGVSAATAGRKYGFHAAGTDADAVFADPLINAVVIATRHDSHARYVVEALRAGKSVFVEKPLALDSGELDQIEKVYQASIESGHAPRLMIGFNRRFAPHVVKMKALLAGMQRPNAVVITVNAGQVPPDHWTHDRLIGGGRVIGEACHFIDLLRFLIEAPAQTQVTTHMEASKSSTDDLSLSLSFENGSIGTIHYFTGGHKGFPKERIEVFCGGRVLQLDNFRTLRGWGWPGFRSMKLWRQDKGAAAMAQAFIASVRQGGPSPIPFDEIVETTRLTIQASGA